MRPVLGAFVAAVTLGVGNIPHASAIDTVDSLDVSKYIGRWYQVYGNKFTAQTVTRDSTCIAADYSLDEATGNITVINSDREHVPTGELNTIRGYAYGVDESEPGQLKVHLGQVPVDGDYWIVALGPETYGSDELYEWAIVSGPDAMMLFVLVRDVPRFDELFKDDVLELIEELGFVGPLKEPQRIVQEGCLPFDPSAPATERTKTSPLMEAMPHLEMSKDLIESIKLDLGNIFTPVETVSELDISRYTGRWFQAYASITAIFLFEDNGDCVTADYTAVDDSTISVVNSKRCPGEDGEFSGAEGFATVEDPSEPGQLLVSLDGSTPAPYWVLALGDEDGTSPYTYSIVSDPFRAFLFVLVRDIENFPGSELETELLALVEQLGFTLFWNKPKVTGHENCDYPSPPAQGRRALDEESKHMHLREPKALEEVFGPLHASCKVSWAFPDTSCKNVSEAIVAAAEDMSGFEDCNGGNKCGYSVTEVTKTSIELVHETSVQHYLDDITITLAKEESSSCEAEGYSTSETWYAHYDNGVNYCNLHNLVEATGLAYEESNVSDDTCTQYSSADCDRY